MKKKFGQLTVANQIDYIKDRYTKIISSIIRDKSNLKKYISCEEAAPVLDPSSSVTKKMETSVVEETNLKLKKEWEEKKKLFDKINELLSNVKEDPNCICVPKEVDLQFCLDNVIPEFELFIDAARTELEKQEFDA